MQAMRAGVDVSSISEGEEDIFTKPVPDHKGRNVTPPDLRKERQIALCKELLKPKYSVDGLKTAHLRDALPGSFRNSAQVRYELRKLIVRGVVKKKKDKSFYVVTQNGWKWLWVTITSNSYFKNPMITKSFKKEVKREVSQPSKIEGAYDLINRGLTQIRSELALIAQP